MEQRYATMQPRRVEVATVEENHTDSLLDPKNYLPFAERGLSGFTGRNRALVEAARLLGE